MLEWFHVGFRESAFKHGQSREDIVHALENKIGSRQVPPKWGQNRVLAFGPNLRGNLIEVIYSVDADSINVFHAQPARPAGMKGKRFNDPIG